MNNTYISKVQEYEDIKKKIEKIHELETDLNIFFHNKYQKISKDDTDVQWSKGQDLIDSVRDKRLSYLYQLSEAELK